MKKNLSHRIMEAISLWQLIDRYKEMSVTELSHLCHRSIEETQEILQILREVDMRESGVFSLIEYPRPNYVKTLSTEGFAYKPQLTRKEITVLIIILEQMWENLTPPDREKASKLQRRLKNLLVQGKKLVEEKKDVDEGEPFSAGIVEFPGENTEDKDLSELYALIQSAIDKQLWLQFDYHSLRSETYKTRLVVPDYLDIRQGHYYLWARERALPPPGERRSPGGMSKQRTWALQRMDNVQEVTLDNKQVQRLIPRLREEDPFNFQGSQEDSQWIHGRLTEKGVWLHEYYQIWPVEEGDNYHVTMPDTGIWTERFALGHAREIQDWKEEEFKIRLRKRAKEGLEAYGELE